MFRLLSFSDATTSDEGFQVMYQALVSEISDSIIQDINNTREFDKDIIPPSPLNSI